ncbi:MAG: hypothetical protein R3F25_11400 [Gammaproteobacteria bacterium]
MGIWGNLFKSNVEIIREKKKIVESSKDDMIIKNLMGLTEKQNEIPLLKARNKLTLTLSIFERKRDELNSTWDAAYENFSWWNKLKYDEKLDLSDLDRQIYELKVAIDKFDSKYQEGLTKLDHYFENLEKLMCKEWSQLYSF